MSKSIKPKDDCYWDSTGVRHNRELLSNLLNNLLGFKPTTIDSGNDPNVTKTYTINPRLCLLFMYNSWGNCGLYLLDKKYNGGSKIEIRTLSACSLATLSSDNVNQLKIAWGQISCTSIILPIFN